MKPQLTISDLLGEAKKFCEDMSKENHKALLGVTDGKAVGTYVEHRFREYLGKKFTIENANSAKGIDIPDPMINTDIKVTSIVQPQSSCPFRSARQKIYGLGYNIILFVYEKQDTARSCKLHFTNCSFIASDRTSDYTITKRLREMVADGANEEDIVAFLNDKNVPGDDIVFRDLAEEILTNKPKQGYLTISNALQWRLQYKRVIGLENSVDGVVNFDW